MRQRLKIDKVDKTMAILSILFFPILLLEISLIVINEIHPFPSLVFYLPFYTTLPYAISVYLVRSLIYHYRIIYTYASIFLLIASLCYTYFFVKVGMMHEGASRWILFTFLGIFYGALLWDFFVGFSHHVDKVSNAFQESVDDYLKKHTNENPILVATEERRKFFTLGVKKDRKSMLGIVTVVFLLPFAILGKGAAYFLGVGLSQYFDAHAYVLSAICFPGTLFFLMLFLPPTIALWRLKYPNE